MTNIMTLPTKVQTAVETLAQYDVSHSIVAPRLYRFFLRWKPETPPPIWDASNAYWIFLAFFSAMVAALLLHIGFAYVVSREAGADVVGMLFNPVTQVIGWTLAGAIGAGIAFMSRSECRREGAKLGLPTWDVFHAAWRPNTPNVLDRANPRRYWLASLANEPVVSRAIFAGVVLFVVVSFALPKRAAAIAEVISIVYLTLALITYNKGQEGKMLPASGRARTAWLIQHGVWIGFLCAAFIWNFGVAVHLWPNPTSSNLSVFLLIAACFHIADRIQFAQSKALAMRIEKSEQDKQLAEMRVQALKAQIEPHFVFNTLAHLKALIREDAKAAEAMTDDLADFLRASTKALGATRVSLREEGALARSYLDLVKRRMGGRLSGSVQLAEDVGDAQVPPWMILTLVENAVKHGVEPNPIASEIRIEASSFMNSPTQTKLRIRVADTGVGFNAAQSHGAGMGLANIRERLQSAYGAEASLTLSANTPHGMVAEIELPLVDGAKS
jgi:two-component sensor histidine kinase